MKTRRPPAIVFAAQKIFRGAFLFAACALAPSAVVKLHAAVWYQTSYNDFAAGTFNYTAIRSTDAPAYIELGRTGAAELSPDDKTVGLWHANDGGAAELSSTVAGSTVVALYRFNNGPPAELSASVVGSTVVALWHMNEANWDEDPTSGMLSQSGLISFTAAWCTDNNNATSAWHTDSSAAGAWCKMDLGAGNEKAYTMARINALSAGYAGNYSIQYSDNDSSWTNAATGFIPSAAGWNSKTWAFAGAHRYWRFYLTNTPGGGSWLQEFEMKTSSAVLDSSANANNGIPYGFVNTISSGMFGRCGNFDGVDDYVDCGNVYNFDGSDFSIELWIKPASISTAYYVLSKSENKTANQQLQLLLNVGGNRNATLSFWSDDLVTTPSWEAGSWNHFSATYKASTKEQRVYWNGRFINSRIANAQLSNTNGQTLTLGKKANGANYFNGQMDEVRITSGVLTALQICQDAGGAVDSSVFGNHGSLNIATQTYTASMTGFGNALQFNGVSDSVTVSHNSSFPRSTITVEFWFRPSAYPSSYCMLVSKGSCGTDGAAEYEISINNTGGIDIYRLKNDNAGYEGNVFSTSIGLWHHLAVTFDGVTVNAYKNGALQRSWTKTNSIYNSSRPLFIGKQEYNAGSPGYFYNGLIDEVRISSGALSATQVAQDAGAYVADSSGKNNFGVAVSTAGTAGGLSMWTGAGGAKFGANALTFDGLNDYVDCGNAIQLGSKNFSVETWVKGSNLNSGQDILSDTNGCVILRGASSDRVIMFLNDWGNYRYSGTINAGAWNHVSYVKEGQTLNAYINGVLSNGALGGTIPSAINTMGSTRLGYYNTYLNGSIDEVRISTTVYSANEIRRDALGPCYTSGDFVSSAFDTGDNGTVFQNVYASTATDSPAATTAKFYVRTSSVTSPYNWTSWYGPYDSGASLNTINTDMKKYRYVQYRSSFTTTNTIYSALMDDCTVQYTANTVPSASLASGVADSQTQITWTANSAADTDPGSDGIEYYFQGSAGNQSWGTGTSFPQSGLTANTQYSCQLKVRDTPWQKESSFSSSLNKYTLAVAPTNANVTCDKSTGTTSSTALFTFSTTFGAGSFQYIKYKWDTNAADTTWPDTWSAGALSQNALTQNTSYYLHIKTYNGDDAANATTLIKGPYLYASAYQSATDTTDTDFNAALVKSSVTVLGAGTPAYVEISGVRATGGTITNVGGYRIHTFTSNGTFTMNVSTNVEVLVVAGGGGGGYEMGGGGGAGGLIYKSSYAVTAQAYNVTVGNGGAGSTGLAFFSGNGGDSVFDTLTAVGGGQGGNNAGVSPPTGGSGGGSGESTYYGLGTTGQGNRGGAAIESSYYHSGGGGGAGAIGANASSSGGGNGGVGLSYSITGAAVTYAGGGGGGIYFSGTPGSGGAGGGGSAGTPGNNGNPGTANTGGGGGGGSHSGVSGSGGNGGSGIVIIRYAIPSAVSGELQSRTIDTTKKGTTWGQISWGQSTPNGTAIKLKTRTGDTATPDGSWSAWSPAAEWFTINTGTPIASPRARYIQYISSFTTSVSTATPQLLEVNIQYSTNTATAPNLISPTDNVWTSSTQPVFKWNFADNEADSQTGFRVQIATHTNRSATTPYGFTGTIANDSGDTSSAAAQYQPPSPLAGGIYYWVVRTSDTYGEWSVYSSTYCVKIDTSGPTGQTITSFSSGISSLTVICGGATDSGGGVHATPYYIEISSASDFAGGTVANSGWVANSHTFTGLARNKKYYAHVRARDVFDNTSGYSPTVEWRAKPGTFQSRAGQGEPTRSGANAFGFVGDASWTWEITTRAGAPLTITAYIRYNSEYGGGATKPKLTLTGRGISPTSISATGAAQDAWEQLTLNPGAPTQNATLTLRAEGFSTTPGAKFYIDDINITP